MAKPVKFVPRVQSAREIGEQRLAQSPLEHADAIVDALRTLQTLHETGTLELVRGLFGAGDALVSQVVDLATSPQSTRALRNLLILMNVLGSIDPDTLEKLARVVTAAVTEQQAGPPPSVWRVARRLFSGNVRRAVGLGIGVVEALGGAGHKPPARM